MDVNVDIHLTRLMITRSATIEEVKKAYKKQAKVCHPDSNPSLNGDRKPFQDLGESFIWLLENYKKWHREPTVEKLAPKSAPAQPKKDSHREAFYRVILSRTSNEHIIRLPFKQVDQDAVVNIMIGMKEYTINLNKGDVLPKTFVKESPYTKIIIITDEFFEQ